jgi:hypothetical protein
MAAACMKAYGARIGIGVTGTMGNVDPANPDASVPGQVYFAIGMDNGICGGDGTTSGQPVIESFHLELAPQPSRLMYKLAVAEEVYKVLIAKLA